MQNVYIDISTPPGGFCITNSDAALVALRLTVNVCIHPIIGESRNKQYTHTKKRG